MLGIAPEQGDHLLPGQSARGNKGAVSVSGCDAGFIGPADGVCMGHFGGYVGEFFGERHFGAACHTPEGVDGHRAGGCVVGPEIPVCVVGDEAVFQRMGNALAVPLHLGEVIALALQLGVAGHKGHVQRLQPVLAVGALDVQSVDHHVAGAQALAGFGAHDAADGADDIVLAVFLAQIHHLVAGEAQRRAQGKRVDDHALFLDRHVGHVDLFHVHVPLPVAVASDLQTEAGVDGADQTGAVLHVHHAAPAVGVAQILQRHHGNVLHGQGQEAYADSGGLGQEGHLLFISAVIPAYRQIDHIVVIGIAVVHQLVGGQIRDQLQNGALSQHAPGGFRGGIGLVGVLLVAVNHQQLLIGDHPGGLPLFLACADGHILSGDPAGAVPAAGQIELLVPGGGVEHQRIVDLHRAEVLVVEVPVGGIVPDGLVGGEDTKGRALHGNGIAEGHGGLGLGVDAVSDHLFIVRPRGRLAVGTVSPAEIVFGVGGGGFADGLVAGLAVKGGLDGAQIHHHGAGGDVGVLIEGPDLFRGENDLLCILMQVGPIGCLGHFGRHIGHIGDLCCGGRQDQGEGRDHTQHQRRNLFCVPFELH